jgi:hypothetical protein
MVGPYADEYYPLRLYGSRRVTTEGVDSQVIGMPNDARRYLQEMLPCRSLFKLSHITHDGFVSACFCDLQNDLFMADLNEVLSRRISNQRILRCSGDRTWAVKSSIRDASVASRIDDHSMSVSGTVT